MSDATMINTERPKNDDAINQLRYLQNVYSQQYELLESQINTYTISIDSISKGLEVLYDVNSITNTKMLINTGPGIYIEATAGNAKTVITYIGAGYLVEKTAEDAKTFIDSNKKKQEDVLKKMITEKLKIQGELIDILYKLEALQQQVV